MPDGLEVEHKFIIPPDIQSRISSLNGTLLKDITFTDIYLDDENNTLALQDTWVRRRNGELQLKHPPANRLQSSVLQYMESTNIEFITSYVDKLLQSSDSRSQTSSVLDEIKPFAEFTTHRLTYSVDDVLIDLDQADFGYRVGEVEVMAGNGISVEDAEVRINNVIGRMSLEIVSRREGKMHAYLFMNNRTLYDKLLAAGVL